MGTPNSILRTCISEENELLKGQSFRSARILAVRQKEVDTLRVKAEKYIAEAVQKIKPILRNLTKPEVVLDSVPSSPVWMPHDLKMFTRRLLNLGPIEVSHREFHWLFLDEDGKFLRVPGYYLYEGHISTEKIRLYTVCERANQKPLFYCHKEPHKVRPTWEALSVGEVIKRLTSAIQTVEEEREKHLDSIKRARISLQALGHQNPKKK